LELTGKLNASITFPFAKHTNVPVELLSDWHHLKSKNHIQESEVMSHRRMMDLDLLRSLLWSDFDNIHVGVNDTRLILLQRILH